MDEPRFLPHLAAACTALLGDDDPKKIPVRLRVQVACKADVSQATVDRFLQGKRVPRSEDLDQMVTAIAAVAEVDWTAPWRDATERAEDAKVKWAAYLTGELPIVPPPPDSGEPGGEKPQRPRR